MNKTSFTLRYYIFILLIWLSLSVAFPTFAQETATLPDNLVTITSDNAPQIEQLSTIQGPSEGIASIALSPNREILAFGSYEDGVIHLIEVSTGEEIMALEGHSRPVTFLVFSPDGSVLASTGTVNLPPEIDGSVRVWAVETGEELAVLETAGINELAFSPDGSLLAGASGSADSKQITLWDIETSTEYLVMDNIYNTVSFSPDGKLLASGTQDNLVHVWDVETGEEMFTLAGHEGWIEATTFSPDGSLLASGSDDTTIRLWDVESGAELRVLVGHITDVEALYFNPDSSLLASLGSGITVTVSGGQFTISMSPEDQVIRIWNAQTGEQITLLEPEISISNVAFNADWTLIVTGSDDGTIILWGVLGT